MRQSKTLDGWYQQQYKNQSKAFPAYLKSVWWQQERFKVTILPLKNWVSHEKPPKIAILYLSGQKNHTVFALISAPGAFEIEIKPCQFMFQLAPPLPTKIFRNLMNSSIFYHF